MAWEGVNKIAMEIVRSFTLHRKSKRGKKARHKIIRVFNVCVEHLKQSATNDDKTDTKTHSLPHSSQILFGFDRTIIQLNSKSHAIPNGQICQCAKDLFEASSTFCI